MAKFTPRAAANSACKSPASRRPRPPTRFMTNCPICAPPSIAPSPMTSAWRPIWRRLYSCSTIRTAGPKPENGVSGSWSGPPGPAFHEGGDQAKAAAFLERGFRAEAAGARSSEGWLFGISGQMAQWFGDTAKCIEDHTAAVVQARAAGNVVCEIMSLTMAAYMKARTGDLAGASELISEASRHDQKAIQ